MNMKREIENLEENNYMDIKRVLTSVLGLPLVIAIIVFGNTTVIDIFFGIVALLGIKEFYDAFEKGENAKPIRWIGYLVALSISVLRLFHLQSALIDIDMDMIIMMFVLIVLSVFVSFFHVLNSGMKTDIVDGCVTVFGIIYIPVLIMFMSMLRSSANGLFVFWYIVICGWGTDVFAYLAGKVLNTKKHKFSKISPNKSVEGCVAGAIRISNFSFNIYNYM